MPELLDWERIGRPETTARFVASALRRGALVAFPTESAFVVCANALMSESVQRLQDIVGGQGLELIVSCPQSVRDWVPGLAGVGQRLTRRFWPGPLTLVCGDGVDGGLASRLPGSVRAALQVDGRLAIRHPAHVAILEVLKRLPVPLVGAGILVGDTEAIHPREVVARGGNQLDLVIVGQGQYVQPTTVVEVRGNACTVHREGIIPTDEVRAHLASLILFVCTGNTCRSPMAEALCKMRLAERLRCKIEELPERGYLVLSAGLAAGPGFPAAYEAIEIVKGLGADLSQHQSRSLTVELANRADHLLVMTRGHARALAQQLPAGASRPRLLSPEGEDVDDPIGGSREIYEQCARQLDGYIQKLIEGLIPSTGDAGKGEQG